MTDKNCTGWFWPHCSPPLTTVMTMVIQVPPMQGYVNLGTVAYCCPPGSQGPAWAERRRGSAPCWPTCSPAMPTTPRAPW